VRPEQSEETGFDRVLGFTIPSRDARGRVVRLGPVLDTILAAHAYPAPIKHLLAEALVLAALIGSLLKDEDGQLTMQAQAEGGMVDLLVCDYRDGELRGYVRHDEERLKGLGVSPSLEALFGTGYLAITFDLAATGQRYQGIVPLEGSSLSEACEHYFVQSEQVPTLIRVAVRSSGEGCVAGGLLVQHLPRARKAAGGCMSSWTIRSGSTSLPWPGRRATTNWSTGRSALRRWSGGCSTKSRKCA
jgi:molecular chaperone Hsp33